MKMLERSVLLFSVAVLALALASAAGAQSYGKPAAKPAEQPATTAPHEGHEKPAAGDKGTAMTATLVEADKKAMTGAATVKVTVKGVRLVDPGLVNEKPQKGQGHLHYQVDDGPVIATPGEKLSFHGLKPGTHRITVMLAANDHTPLGPKQTLEVTIPASASMK